MSGIRVYMVRHGQTYFNYFHRFQGWSDAPLTDSGIADGKAAGQRLAQINFAGVYSSDLTRAVHTARYILTENATATSTEPVQLPEFREQFFGTFDGMAGDEATDLILPFAPALTQEGANGDGINDYGRMITQLGMAKTMDSIAAADPNDFAEDYATFWSRVMRGLDTIRARHNDGDRVLVVAHGTLIRAIADHYGYHEFASQSVKNGAVMELDLQADGLEVVNFNDDTTYYV
jgi:probable phosphoglycerate mutase